MVWSVDDMKCALLTLSSLALISGPTRVELSIYELEGEKRLAK